MSIDILIAALVIGHVIDAKSNDNDVIVFKRIINNERIFQPLPPLPDMIQLVHNVNPPSFAPPKNYKERLRLDESMGFIVNRGMARIMGFSRKKKTS
ncbi:hypothetical protein DICVIV_12730 [Dictyocaulus viviparus]|uniref:Uncharacterized protein n=1 Tax=Dictyocaulus viviparus TaxID=29172 RepID=A0A0D8XCC4_DICVI|nr:hypothetical protein DICVIV_12730 [Dictyocaulus viviparus]